MFYSFFSQVRKKPANFDEDQTRKAAEMKKLAGQTSGVFGAGNSLPEPMRLLKVSSLIMSFLFE